MPTEDLSDSSDEQAIVEIEAGKRGCAFSDLESAHDFDSDGVCVRCDARRWALTHDTRINTEDAFDLLKSELAGILNEAILARPIRPGQGERERIGDLYTQCRQICSMSAQLEPPEVRGLFSGSLKAASVRAPTLFAHFKRLCESQYEKETSLLLIIQHQSIPEVEKLVRQKNMEPLQVEEKSPFLFHVTVARIRGRLLEQVTTLVEWLAEPPKEPPFSMGTLIWYGERAQYYNRKEMRERGDYT